MELNSLQQQKDTEQELCDFVKILNKIYNIKETKIITLNDKLNDDEINKINILALGTAILLYLGSIKETIKVPEIVIESLRLGQDKLKCVKELDNPKNESLILLKIKDILLEGQKKIRSVNIEEKDTELELLYNIKIPTLCSQSSSCMIINSLQTFLPVYMQTLVQSMEIEYFDQSIYINNDIEYSRNIYTTINVLHYQQENSTSQRRRKKDIKITSELEAIQEKCYLNSIIVYSELNESINKCLRIINSIQKKPYENIQIEQTIIMNIYKELYRPLVQCIETLLDRTNRLFKIYDEKLVDIVYNYIKELEDICNEYKVSNDTTYKQLEKTYIQICHTYKVQQQELVVGYNIQNKRVIEKSVTNSAEKQYSRGAFSQCRGSMKVREILNDNTIDRNNNHEQIEQYINIQNIQKQHIDDISKNLENNIQIKQQNQPKQPKGTKDSSPEEMILKQELFKIITECFQRHGAVCIDTPVFERKETLLGKYGEDTKQIYDIADQGGELLSLRYDQTVPFARYCSTNGITNIRRYHIAKVYRRDNPAMNRGRFREFYQCDYDIAGIYPSMQPEIEILKVLVEILDNIGLNNEYIIKLNHRVLLDSIMLVSGVPDNKQRTICSSIDKLDKQSWDDIKIELLDKGINENIINNLYEYVIINDYGTNITNILNKLRSYNKQISLENAKNSLDEQEQQFIYLKEQEIDNKILQDMSLARGQDYYTGQIYEVILIKKDNDIQNVGSIAAGGRYDNLIGMFSGKQVPAVGCSIGVERVQNLLENRLLKNRKLPNKKTVILVASIGSNMLQDRIRITNMFWKSNIPAEFLYHKNPNIRKQMEYAFENQIPFIAWYGEEEKEKNILRIKSLDKDKESAEDAYVIPISEACEYIQSRIPCVKLFDSC